MQQQIGQESCESQSRRSSNWLNMRPFVVILTAVVLLEHVSFAFGDQSAVNSLINLQKRIDYRTCIGKRTVSSFTLCPSLYWKAPSKSSTFESFSDRFDVHADTIIQTDESRAMGATFLYHVETLNRNECLEVCCQTDRCDVSIFEEKVIKASFELNIIPTIKLIPPSSSTKAPVSSFNAVHRMTSDANLHRMRITQSLSSPRNRDTRNRLPRILRPLNRPHPKRLTYRNKWSNCWV